MGCSVVFRLLILFSVTFVAIIKTCECKASEFDPWRESQSNFDFGQTYSNVASENSDWKISGNVLDGNLSVSTSPTNEEILERMLIGGGVIVLFVCCCVCCKQCCCPSKPSTVIMYQQMPPPAQPQPQQPASIHTIMPMPGDTMIPLQNQGFPEIPLMYSPPPPYPGLTTA